MTLEIKNALKCSMNLSIITIRRQLKMLMKKTKRATYALNNPNKVKKVCVDDPKDNSVIKTQKKKGGKRTKVRKNKKLKKMNGETQLPNSG